MRKDFARDSIQQSERGGSQRNPSGRGSLQCEDNEHSDGWIARAVSVLHGKEVQCLYCMVTPSKAVSVLRCEESSAKFVLT